MENAYKVGRLKPDTFYLQPSTLPQKPEYNDLAFSLQIATTVSCDNFQISRNDIARGYARLIGITSKEILQQQLQVQNTTSHDLTRWQHHLITTMV
jgi:hypothetical protein